MKFMMNNYQKPSTSFSSLIDELSENNEKLKSENQKLRNEISLMKRDLNMFAKIDAVDVIKCLFDEKVVMTPKIRDEISAPIEYEYTFPIRACRK
ncbi:MAG: hypothetical protein U9N61_03065, partial [Euryarchaeota archaeon]|nr:hypothetical protein [Euryarchaeota archaeon]